MDFNSQQKVFQLLALQKEKETLSAMQPQLAEGEYFLTDQIDSLSAEGLKFCFLWPAMKITEETER